jgi:hypothetical protein
MHATADAHAGLQGLLATLLFKQPLTPAQASVSILRNQRQL